MAGIECSWDVDVWKHCCPVARCLGSLCPVADLHTLKRLVPASD